MNCVKCGVELKDGAKFCKICGAPQTTGPRKCVKCGAELDADARFCDACGAPQQPGTVVPPVTATPPVAQVPPPNLPPKKLVTYRMLSLFLGGLGIHSFYAGDTNKGIIQLVLCWTGISGLWALIDVFKVTTDAYGRPMEDTVPKSRTTYRLLALFCGGIGAHNFYAGYLGRGLVQILLCWTGISWLWALVEIFAVEKDANGNPMIIGPDAEKIGNKIAGLSIALAVAGLLNTIPLALNLPLVCVCILAGVACLVIGFATSLRKSDIASFILITLGLVLLVGILALGYRHSVGLYKDRFCNYFMLSIVCGIVSMGLYPRNDGDAFAMLSMGFALPLLAFYFNILKIIVILLGILCGTAALKLRPPKGGGAVVVSVLGRALRVLMYLCLLRIGIEIVLDWFHMGDTPYSGDSPFFLIDRILMLIYAILGLLGCGACGIVAVCRRRWLGIAGIVMSLAYLIWVYGFVCWLVRN